MADHIGIPLVTVKTDEILDDMYVQNNGQACFACKTALYKALHAVADYAVAGDGGADKDSDCSVNDDNDYDKRFKNYQSQSKNVTLFNGTNADDQLDETRVGLVAARNFNVASPLGFISKEEVREASRHLGLPNWNYAASPCLRSRLAFGVHATNEHLKLIENAENLVKSILEWDEDVTKNLRVRMMAKKRAVIELDKEIDLDSAIQVLKSSEINTKLNAMGFAGDLDIRPFKSGSVANRRPVENVAKSGNSLSKESIQVDKYFDNEKDFLKI